MAKEDAGYWMLDAGKRWLSHQHPASSIQHPFRTCLVAAALLLGACAKNIDEGKRIEDIAAPEDKPVQEKIPVQKTERISGDSEKAIENYQKLLDLPQDPQLRAETLRRLADLQMEQDEQGGATFEQTEQHLRQSIALYNTVLTENPTDPQNDRVLYQLSRAYQNVGEIAKAEEVLLRLTKDYPQSSYADDAHFRRAELLFRLGQFDKAEAEYKHILDLKDATAFFEPAQYKYGWSQYRQSKYDASLETFLAILTRLLPAGEQADPDAALDAVQAGKKDMAKDAMRVATLSLIYLGGGDAANQYFKSKPEPGYTPALYRALAEALLEKKRYTDAAKAYGAFIASHPRHPVDPQFQNRAIAAEEAGGFAELVMQEKEKFVRTYDPAAPFWSQGTPATPEALKALRTHLEDLGRYYQAKAQKERDAKSESAKADFLAATKWYQRLLDLYPADAKAADIRFLLADALFDGGLTTQAAAQYTKVSTDYAGYARAPEAAYAAVLAWQRNATEVPAAQKNAALRLSIDASKKFGEKFPQHPKAIAALTRAAEDLALLQAWDEAIATADKVLKVQPPAEESLRRAAWSVTADGQFNQKRYPQAETAYTQELNLLAADAPERKTVSERLAACIYKQGEAARAANDLKGAAKHFLRVGQAVPAASIRATADYDGATMLILAKDWAQAATVLEGFRASFPASPLLADVDKKLAVAYQNSGKLPEAAAVFQRIAARADEKPDVRMEAAWLAADLLDKAHDLRALAAYESYVKQYPMPLDRAQDARQKLMQDAADHGVEPRRLEWLRAIITADNAAGAARTDHSHQLAARAQLEFGRLDVAKATRIPLRAPLKQTVPVKKKALEEALATLSRAADYGFADVTTAATFEIGRLYQDFSESLLKSDRPKLKPLELEQYNVLLEEQAFPFEEKAIQWHETNLKRVTQGIAFNEWIGKSLEALAQMAPGKYGKREQTAEAYDAVR